MIARGLARLAVWGCALLGIASYAWLGAKRLFYPLELDCIEGVMMDHVVRLAHGQPVFVAPTLGFIPLAYMPLFATVSSLLARVFHPALWEPRLVSYGSSLLLMALLAGVVLAETRRPTLAVAAAGFYGMAFGHTGGCYDVARPDSLMLLLAFAGLATLRFTRGARGAVAAGLLLALAFYAKQHAALFGAGALAYVLVHDRRRAVPFALAWLVGTAGAYLLLMAWLGPWFRYFTYTVPRGWSELSRARLFAYAGQGLLGRLVALTVPSVLALGLPGRPWRSPSGLWMWTGLAGVGTGVLATLDPSAYLHVLTPSVVAFAVLGPVSLDRLARRLDEGPAAPGMTDGRGSGLAIAYAVLALGTLPLFYPLHSQMPRPHAAGAHRELLARIRALPGPVLVPYHGFYAWQATGRSGLQIIALDDILRAHGNDWLRRDPQALERLFAPLRSGPGRPTILTDVPLERSGVLWRMIAPGYALADSLPASLSETLRPVTGNRFTPTYVYRPVGGAEPATTSDGQAR